MMTTNQQLHTNTGLNIYTGDRSVDAVLSLSDQVPLIGSNLPYQSAWSEAKYRTLPLELISRFNLPSSFTAFQVFSVSLCLVFKKRVTQCDNEAWVWVQGLPMTNTA